MERMRWLGVDHPLLAADLGDRAHPGILLAKDFESAVKLELALAPSMFECLEIQTTKQPAEHAHGQEEVRSASNPSLLIQGESATRHDAVHVRMVEQDLAPSVEHREEADLSTQVLWIGGDGAQCLCRDLQEQAVAQTLVLQRDVGKLVRKSEDDVEVRDVQQFSLSGCKPFGTCCCLTLGTVSVAAGVVGDLFVTTRFAPKLVTAQRSRPTQRELAQDTLLLQRVRVGLAIG
jgi:hypothetical protein